MKKYLLTVIAEVRDTSFVDKLVRGLTPIVDSPGIKYQHTNGVILIHFESEIDQIQILDYVSGLLYGLTDTYILSELDDKTSVVMPEETRAHLLNLSGETDVNNTYFDPHPNIDKESTEEFINFLLEEFEDEIKIPTLNEILDKILDKGMNSLTQLEKQKLEEYSKN